MNTSLCRSCRTWLNLGSCTRTLIVLLQAGFAAAARSDDLLRIMAARRLGHHGKALFCGSLAGALLFYMSAGQEIPKWAV